MNSSSLTSGYAETVWWKRGGVALCAVAFAVSIAWALIDPRPRVLVANGVILMLAAGLGFLAEQNAEARIVASGVELLTLFGVRRRVLHWQDIEHLIEVVDACEGGYFITPLIVPRDPAVQNAPMLFANAKEREEAFATLEENGVTVVRDDRDPREDYLGLTTIDLP